MSTLSSSLCRTIAASRTCSSRSARRSATICLISSYLRGWSVPNARSSSSHLTRVDAEPVRDRRVDLEGLARLAHLRLLAHVLDRAHVVEPVRELDQDHADVAGHRDDELAVVLRLGLLAARELDARQLGDALDEHGDLLAELGLDVLDLDAGVLDRVVEQRRGDRRLVHPQPGEDLGHAPRMVDELLTRTAHLAFVGLGRELERMNDQIPVDRALDRTRARRGARR